MRLIKTVLVVAAGTLLAIRGTGAVTTAPMVVVVEILVEVAAPVAGTPPPSGDFPHAASKIPTTKTNPNPFSFIPPS